MFEDVVVRAYRQSDEAAVDDLMERTLRDAGAWFENAPDDGGVPAGALGDDGAFLVAERDGEVIATGAVRPVDGHVAGRLDGDPEVVAEVKRMYVRPDLQRSGVGGRLLDALLDRARGFGYDRVVLATTTLQASGLAFYRANGFAEVDREHVEAEGRSFEMVFVERSLE